MKIGVHSATFVKDWSEDITPYIIQCKEAGYNCVEVSLLGQTYKNAEKIYHLAKELNIIITCTTGLAQDEDISSDNSEVRMNGIKALKKAIEITSIMGSSILTGVIHCAWGISKSKGKNKQDKYKYSSDSIKETTSILENNKIKLGIEPLNRYETDFINTVDEGLKLCSLINHPNVGLLLDVYHMNIEEKDISKSIINAKNKLFHFHVAENDRGIPGTGSIKWEKIFNALKEINYDEYVTLEMFIQANQNTSKDLFTWRNIEEDVFNAISKSFEFLNKY
ncbi:MAG: D-tagatose 3-epimerase [Alphaproteobacteria bacterium MarineAlpha5_Bin5]|nr:MAG: D-tagatose 3-epimerase [Alphaproteobacteria bacterium MarineAlpha5_Bin4]PPR49737.1 MAG: D-tagatose 3-epimerase [Alphaproteobacteria bacterium MarineAlpha5_Bin5]